MSAAELNKLADLRPAPIGHDIGPHGSSGRTSHFMAGMNSGSAGNIYQYGPPRSSHSGGNELSLREAQHILTMPSDVFHSSISGGMPGWDTSRAGLPVQGI